MGDHVDVYLSDNPTAGNGHTAARFTSMTGTYEHKVMYGLTHEEVGTRHRDQYEDG